MPIAVDGTSRHEAPRVHCTLGGTSSPHQLSRWWLLGGDEGWATLYAATQELDFKKTIMGCSWRHLQVYLVCCPGNTFFPVYRWQGGGYLYIHSYSFVYHLYVSGRRRTFVANGVARKVLKTRRARNAYNTYRPSNTHRTLSTPNTCLQRHGQN